MLTDILLSSRRSIVISASVALLVYCSFPVTSDDIPQSSSADGRDLLEQSPPVYAPDSVIIKRKPAIRSQLRTFYGENGLRLRKELPLLEAVEVIEIADPELTVAGAIRLLEDSGLVEYAQPNFIYRALATPNDPSFTNQWALHNLGQTGGTSDADIDAPEAWDTRTSASSTIVAVIDSGARLTHEDLAANLWTNAGEIAGDGIDNDGNGWVDDVHGINTAYDNGDPTDDLGHGTHVAGIIGAIGNNGKGVSGVAWSVQLMPLKCLDNEGAGFTEDIADAIIYAISRGAHIINASLGGPVYDQTLYNAINLARTYGRIFVAAAGNDANDNDRWFTFPAGYHLDNIVSVAASAHDDTLAFYSSYGYLTADLAAPGGDGTEAGGILSTGYSANDEYVVSSGTSMAAPHVSGALALIKAATPSEGYHSIIYRLLGNVDKLDAFQSKCLSGGRLNLQKALYSTSQSVPPNDLFANRTVIAGTAITTFGRNVGASKEAGEPNHAGNAGGKSVWWSWTAPASGYVEITTANSFTTSDGTFNTLLGVYTGTSVNSLTPVASNDDSSISQDGATTSRTSFLASPGVEYQIAVDGNAAAAGVIKLAIHYAPLNDNLSAYTKLAEDFIAADAVNTGATKESSEASHAGNSGGRSLWWGWKAPLSGTFALTTHGSGFDTLLAVYTGSAHPLTLVASNDNDSDTKLKDDYGGKTSALTFSASEGQLYFIAVDGVGGAFGNIVLAGGYEHSVNSIALLGSNTEAVNINEAGQLAGHSPAINPKRGFFYDSSKVDIGHLGAGETRCFALGDDGTIVGESLLNSQFYAYVWRAATGMSRLDSSSYSSGARGINSYDLPVGFIYDRTCGNAVWTACYWTNSSYVTLPLPTGAMSSTARAVNDTYDIVGDFLDVIQGCDPRGQNPVLWELRKNPVSTRILPAVGPPGIAAAEDVNRRGQIAGAYLLGSVSRALIWSDLRPVEYGTIGGWSSFTGSLNDRSQLSGSYNTIKNLIPGEENERAMLMQNDVIIDLNRLIPPQTGMNAWDYLEEAFDLNNSGIIVGKGSWWQSDGTHSISGFVLTPPTFLRITSSSVLTNDHFQLSIAGPNNLACTIEAGSDLVAGPWSSLTNISLSATGTASFIDTDAGTYSYRYYRVRSQTGSKLSINCVGFLEVQLPSGKSLIANPFRGADNRVPALLSSLPTPVTILKWDEAGATYRANQYAFGIWGDYQMTLEPGEAFYVDIDSAATVKFSGEVSQGSLKTPLPEGLAMRGSPFPRSGGIDSALELSVENGDKIHKWNNASGTTTAYTYLNGTWSPSAPSVALGEGFWTEKVNPALWRQSLSVW